jgi:hypothetical protein
VIKSKAASSGAVVDVKMKTAIVTAVLKICKEEGLNE